MKMTMRAILTPLIVVDFSNECRFELLTIRRVSLGGDGDVGTLVSLTADPNISIK